MQINERVKSASYRLGVIEKLSFLNNAGVQYLLCRVTSDAGYFVRAKFNYDGTI